MKGFNLLCKKAKGVLSGILGTLAVACLALGISVMPTATKTVNAEGSTATTYAKAYKMNRVERNANEWFIDYNPNGDSFGGVTYVQTSNFRFNPTGEAYDIALTWTAPSDGTFYAIRSAANNVALTTELDGYTEGSPQTAKVAFVKAQVDANNGVISNLTSVISGTDENSIFKSLVGTKENMQTNITVGYGAPISIKAGESFMLIIKKPSDHHQVQVNAFSIKFTPEGGEEQTYDVNNTCVNTAGVLESNLLSFYAIDAESYVQFGTPVVGSEVANTVNYKKTVDYTLQNGTGLWVNVENSSSWQIAYNGNAYKIATWAAWDNTVYYEATQDATIANIADATFAKASGTSDPMVGVLKYDASTGIYTALSSGTDGKNTVTADKGYTLSDVTVALDAGDQILFVAYRVSAAEQVYFSVNLQTMANGELNAYSLGQGDVTTSQGQYGFHYGKLVAKDYNDVKTFGMVDGASIRLGNMDAATSGIRFAAQMSKMEYEMLQSIYGENIEFGVLMMPKDYLAETAHGALTEETMFGDNNTYSLKKEDGKTQILGAASTQMYVYSDAYADPSMVYLRYSMITVQESNYARDFVATAYIKVTVNGVAEYKFLDVSDSDTSKGCVRSVAEVAQARLNDESENGPKEADEIALLEKYAAALEK